LEKKNSYSSAKPLCCEWMSGLMKSGLTIWSLASITFWTSTLFKDWSTHPNQCVALLTKNFISSLRPETYLLSCGWCLLEDHITFFSKLLFKSTVKCTFSISFAVIILFKLFVWKLEIFFLTLKSYSLNPLTPLWFKIKICSNSPPYHIYLWVRWVFVEWQKFKNNTLTDTQIKIEESKRKFSCSDWYSVIRSKTWSFKSKLRYMNAMDLFWKPISP